jgi:hypothetical protein
MLRKQKSQKPDEGVSRASDRGSRRRLLKALPPSLCAEHPQASMHAEFQFWKGLQIGLTIRCNSCISRLMEPEQNGAGGSTPAICRPKTLSEQIVPLTVRILERLKVENAFRPAL